MAFTFTNYAALPLQKEPWTQALQNAIQGYQDITKASYLQPNLSEDLKKKQLVNQYYGPNIESQMGLRGAQTKESGARTGLLGEQTRAAHIKNQYLPQQLDSQIQQLLIQRELMNKFMNINSGRQNNNVNTNSDSLLSNLGNNSAPGISQPIIPRSSPLLQTEPTNQSTNSQSQPNALSYPEAAILMKTLGLGHPKIENIGGQFTALTPFGNIPVAQGLTPLQTELAKKDAEKISTLDNIVLSSSPKSDTLNQMTDILTDPVFEQLRQHPLLGKHELAWYSKNGTPEEQRMVGNLKAMMGDVVKSSAGDFKGQFRVGEQALLNSMKPNESDSLEVMKGKVEALRFMVNAMTERARIESQAMRNMGMNIVQARDYSDSIFKPKELKQKIHDSLNPRKIPTPEEAREELARRRG